jgi:hypothetical protein
LCSRQFSPRYHGRNVVIALLSPGRTLPDRSDLSDSLCWHCRFDSRGNVVRISSAGCPRDREDTSRIACVRGAHFRNAGFRRAISNGGRVFVAGVYRRLFCGAEFAAKRGYSIHVRQEFLGLGLPTSQLHSAIIIPSRAGYRSPPSMTRLGRARFGSVTLALWLLFLSCRL